LQYNKDIDNVLLHFQHIFRGIHYNDWGQVNRIQQVAKGATCWQEASEALRNAVFETHFGKPRHRYEGEKISFKALAEMYIEDHAKINKASWRTDQCKVNEMKKFFKGRPADSITSQDIEQYKAHKKGQDRKLTTINKHIQVLSKLFNCGIKWGYLKENPCKGVKKYSEESFRRARVLSKEEEARLLKAIGPEHLKSMVKIFLNTDSGARNFSTSDGKTLTLRSGCSSSGRPRLHAAGTCR